jgi:hypothetical protein
MLYLCFLHLVTNAGVQHHIHVKMMFVSVNSNTTGATSGAGTSNTSVTRRVPLVEQELPTLPRAAPKIGKNMIFWRKIVIFHTKYPKYFRASLRSAQFF